LTFQQPRPYNVRCFERHPVSRIRSISLFTATCIVIANMIGTGGFHEPGFQVGGLPTGFSIVALWLVGGDRGAVRGAGLR